MGDTRATAGVFGPLCFIKTIILLKTGIKYVIATGISSICCIAYLNVGLAHLKGHDAGYAIFAGLGICIVIALLNLLYFIPGSILKIKYCLPGIITTTLTLWAWIVSNFQIDEGMGLVYLPSLINTTLGLYFFI